MNLVVYEIRYNEATGNQVTFIETRNRVRDAEGREAGAQHGTPEQPGPKGTPKE